VRVAVDPVDAEPHLVDVAPAPVFARLERTDDRMLRRLCVRSRVAVRRVIASADVTASKTDAQVQPLAADAQEILAALDRGRHVSNQDLIKMGAHVVHRAPSLTAVLR
jgi:hypothetical protein